MFAAERHHDDLLEEGDRGEKESRFALRSESAVKYTQNPNTLYLFMALHAQRIDLVDLPFLIRRLSLDDLANLWE